MGAADDLERAFLTAALTDDQRAELLAVGTIVEFDDGDVLFVEGDPADHLWMLLEGTIELSRQAATDTMVVGRMTTPGQWAGGLRAWGGDDSGAGYRGTGRAVGAGRALQVPSAELGRLVGEWFPFGKHMIVGIYQTVRSIEAMARQRESLVALGTLAAGLAHELNNPAAAAIRSVEGLRRTCDDMLGSLTELAAATITADQFVALDALRADAAATEAPAGGALALADREEAMGQWLADRGVAGAWSLAPALAATGVDTAWCEQVAAAVGDGPLDDALRWVVSTLTAGTLLTELQDTTSRISNLVGAVKSYSQVDRASRQRADVHDGLESTIVMLSHKLRGVEVVRAYGDVPEFEHYPGELNQVWTNLIDNAVDAMEGSGTLTVTTGVDGTDVRVAISDTGHGMPEVVQARAFEPFFTTKDVGKGTGLGLDISRRIVVERHGGDITFTSTDAGTTVHVRLPLER